jgi:DNA-binding LytR/AlgR family response regulator
MLNTILPRLRGPGLVFLYWLVFLLALEPGNFLHARSMGRTLEFDTEALRITVAALLGSSSAPWLVMLARKFPFSATPRWRTGAIHAASVMAISFLLILASCFLAAWVLMSKPLPSMQEITSQLAANWLLLTFALGAFAVLIQVVKPLPRRSARSIPICTRGRLGYLDVADIEWIESQGNYLALHAAGKSHLIRGTLSNFSAQIDPERFLRVHRRTIVDMQRVREIQPLANGDSLLILHGGHAIRASRNYREAVRQRWPLMARE